MKFVYSLLFSLMLAAAAFAQTQPAQNVKVMFINTELFAAKTGGITRYVAALEKVDGAFNPAREQLRTMITRHDALAREVMDLQNKVNAAPAGAAATALSKQLETKVEEGRTLETDIKRRQEDNRLAREKQFAQAVSPILEEIRGAMQEYSRLKGYQVVIDVSKMGAALVVFDEKADITKDFITWFNTGTRRTVQ